MSKQVVLPYSDKMPVLFFIPTCAVFICRGTFVAGFSLLFFLHSAVGQAPRFSQYEAVPMMLNPALAGAAPDITLNANYRAQRLGQVKYQTGYFSAILPLYQQGQEPTQVGGLALSAGNDMAGELGEVKTVEARFTGAYNVLLTKYNTHLLTFGIQGGYKQTRVDFGLLQWPSQMTYDGFDPSKHVPLDQYEQRFGNFKVAAGAFWMYEPGNNPYKNNSGFKLYAGFSADNMNRPSRSLVQGSTSQVPLLYKIHGGSEHYINDQLSIAPSFFVISQHGHVQYSLGTLFNLFQEVNSASNPQWTQLMLQFGAWYRLSDAAVFLVGMGNRTFNAALSYDVSMSTERTAINNQQAFELSLAYRFLRKNEPVKISTPLF